LGRTVNPIETLCGLEPLVQRRQVANRTTGGFCRETRETLKLAKLFDEAQ